MSSTIRHDAIALKAGANAQAFESFMSGELMPHFVQRFKGPTRVSKADLTSITLLRDAKSKRRFLLVTVWIGAATAVAGAAFENARMNSAPATDDMLSRLDGFAKRSAEKVYSVLFNAEVTSG
jgi:hypothetical protein